MFPQAIQKSMQINGTHVNMEAVNYDGQLNLFECMHLTLTKLI